MLSINVEESVIQYNGLVEKNVSFFDATIKIPAWHLYLYYEDDSISGGWIYSCVSKNKYENTVYGRDFLPVARVTDMLVHNQLTRYNLLNKVFDI
jgi:hypothetical protein